MGEVRRFMLEAVLNLFEYAYCKVVKGWAIDRMSRMGYWWIEGFKVRCWVPDPPRKARRSSGTRLVLSNLTGYRYEY